MSDRPTKGALSLIENSVSKDDPKWQVALDRVKVKQTEEFYQESAKTPEVLRYLHHSSLPFPLLVWFFALFGTASDRFLYSGNPQKHARYMQERATRKVYRDKELHLSVLQLIMSLFLAPSGLLEPYYADQYPTNNKKLNIPYLLHLHINHPENSSIIPDLCEVRRCCLWLVNAFSPFSLSLSLVLCGSGCGCGWDCGSGCE